MGVPKEELTPQEKFQADRLAKIQFAEIRNNRKYVEFINDKFHELLKQGKVPCGYQNDFFEIGFIPNYAFIPFISRLFDDIATGKIVLPNDTDRKK